MSDMAESVTPDFETQRVPQSGTGAAPAAMDAATDSEADENVTESSDDNVEDASSGEWQPPPGSRFDNEEGSAGQPWEEQPLDWRGGIIAPPPELHSPSESLQELLKALTKGSVRHRT